MHYIDTSALVAALAGEPLSERVWSWLASQPEGEVAISPWVVSELSSALSIKIRSGALTIEQRAQIFSNWHQLLEDGLLTLSISTSHFETAARFADRHELGLRAADALHLAIAADAGCTLVTLDQVMAAAAPHVGVPVDAI